jgi:iron(II)-dependent oxidoreductase
MVNINWYEAEAYSKWAGRLPTEAEWDLAASTALNSNGDGFANDKRWYPWGYNYPKPDMPISTHLWD